MSWNKVWLTRVGTKCKNKVWRKQQKHEQREYNTKNKTQGAIVKCEK